MGKEFEKILRLHEKEDEKYIFCEEDIITRMMNEFQNAQELLELLSSNSAHAVDFFTMSEFPSRWPVIPIRKSDKFYIKKHTSTQKPYFTAIIFMSSSMFIGVSASSISTLRTQNVF